MTADQLADLCRRYPDREFDIRLAVNVLGAEVVVASTLWRPAELGWYTGAGLDRRWIRLPHFFADTAEGWAAMRLVIRAVMDCLFSVRSRFFRSLQDQARLQDGTTPDGLWAIQVLSHRLPAAVAEAALAAVEAKL